VIPQQINPKKTAESTERYAMTKGCPFWQPFGFLSQLKEGWFCCRLFFTCLSSIGLMNFEQNMG